MNVAAIDISDESPVQILSGVGPQGAPIICSPGLYILTRVSGFPLVSGLSPPTTTALAPSRWASRTLSTNWHWPRCTRAIHVSVGSGLCGPLMQRVSHARLSPSLRTLEAFADAQGVVNEESGITYPNSGSSSSVPNIAGLAEKVNGRLRSTTDTVLSPQPKVQLKSQPPLSDLEVGEKERCRRNKIGWEWIWAERARSKIRKSMLNIIDRYVSSPRYMLGTTYSSEDSTRADRIGARILRLGRVTWVDDVICRPSELYSVALWKAKMKSSRSR